MKALAISALVLLLLPATQSAAQAEIVYDFELEGPPAAIIDTQFQEELRLPITFRDLSRDATLGGHQVRWTVDVQGDASGWIVAPPIPLSTTGGNEYVVDLRVIPTASVTDPYMQMTLTANVTTQLGTFARSLSLAFFTDGVPGFTVSPQGSITFGPRDVATATFRVSSLASLPQTIQFEIVENPCNLRAAAPSTVTLPGRGVAMRSITVQGPEEKFWYNSESCFLRVEAYSTTNPDLVRSTVVGVDVDGFYVAPEWVFWTVAILLAAAVVLLFLRRRKEAIEEEILGKPQKPWTIPVEQVYLRHLRARDERAWYMVRHHLMEEEYQSALLWHKNYRKATRGQHTKERAVLRHERELDAWRAKWERRIERPEQKVERMERRLQKGLDRAARSRHKQGLRKHASVVAKIEKAHANKVQRLTERHEKQVARAQKKGLAAPPPPSVPAAQFPDQPTLQAVPLSDHKLQKKVDRAWRHAHKKRGNLEVRYERKEARKLHQIRKRVRRVARKIDDPDFVREHPLLQGD